MNSVPKQTASTAAKWCRQDQCVHGFDFVKILKSSHKYCTGPPLYRKKQPLSPSKGSKGQILGTLVDQAAVLNGLNAGSMSLGPGLYHGSGSQSFAGRFSLHPFRPHLGTDPRKTAGVGQAVPRSCQSQVIASSTPEVRVLSAFCHVCAPLTAHAAVIP